MPAPHAHHHRPLFSRRVRGALLLGLAATALLSAGCAVSRLQASAELIRGSEPLQARPTQSRYRLLILGDSTAVGTGASSGRSSIAGLIAAEHPDWTIVNRGIDGAKFADLPGQLPPASEHYDTVLIICGGNDVIRLTSEDVLRRSVREIAERSRSLAPRVILMPPGNVGSAPFFYAPLSWWMSSRARMLHRAVREAADATGAVYVNLYREPEGDPFVRDAQRMNAADGLHPSDAGYVLWHGTLKEQAGL